MGICFSRQHSEPWQPREYDTESQIPFAAEGRSPLIANTAEKVLGRSGAWKSRRYVRKTIWVKPPRSGRQSWQSTTKKQLVKEAKTIHEARHHHVVKLIHTYFFNRGDEYNYAIQFSFVMERAESNLSTYLTGAQRPNSQWFGCLVEAVRYIHRRDIRHKDIKPCNILVISGRVLLSDFGLSKMGTSGQDRGRRVRTYSHSRILAEYCAPEAYGNSNVGLSADIFSLGAVFLEMLTSFTYPAGFDELTETLAVPEHEKLSYAESIENVREWMRKIESKCTGWQIDVLDTCQGMLSLDCSKRPSAQRLSQTWVDIAGPNASMACEQCIKSRQLSGEKQVA